MRADLLELRSLRSTSAQLLIGLILTLGVCALVAVALAGLAASASAQAGADPLAPAPVAPDPTLDQVLFTSRGIMPLLCGAFAVGGLGAVLAGRHVNYGLLATPSRTAVALRRVGAVLLIAVIASVLALALGGLLAWAVAALRDAPDLQVQAGPVALQLLAAAVLALCFAGLGAGLGMLTRGTAVGVLLLLVILWGLPLVLGIVGIFAPWVQRVADATPSFLAQRMGPELTGDWWLGAAGLLAWGAAAVLLGLQSMRRYRG